LRSTAISRAFRPCPSCNTADPTPPLAPVTSSVSRRSSFARVTSPRYAVTKFTRTQAACSKRYGVWLGSDSFHRNYNEFGMGPIAGDPTSPPVPQTPVPDKSLGPAITVPAKSRPGMRGRIVPSIFPLVFFTSLGFTEAAKILILASPRVTVGSGTSSTLRFFRVLLNAVI